MGETSMKYYAMWFVLGLIMVSPILFFVAGVYGDYQSTGKLPWKTKKDKVNSGAKFG